MSPPVPWTVLLPSGALRCVRSLFFVVVPCFTGRVLRILLPRISPSFSLSFLHPPPPWMPGVLILVPCFRPCYIVSCDMIHPVSPFFSISLSLSYTCASVILLRFIPATRSYESTSPRASFSPPSSSPSFLSLSLSISLFRFLPRYTGTVHTDASCSGMFPILLLARILLGAPARYKGVMLPSLAVFVILPPLCSRVCVVLVLLPYLSPPSSLRYADTRCIGA